jgi:hypothetical protein
MRMAIGSLTKKWRRLGHELGFGAGIAHGFAASEFMQSLFGRLRSRKRVGKPSDLVIRRNLNTAAETA